MRQHVRRLSGSVAPPQLVSSLHAIHIPPVIPWNTSHTPATWSSSAPAATYRPLAYTPQYLAADHSAVKQHPILHIAAHSAAAATASEQALDACQGTALQPNCT